MKDRYSPCFGVKARGLAGGGADRAVVPSDGRAARCRGVPRSVVSWRLWGSGVTFHGRSLLEGLGRCFLAWGGIGVEVFSSPNSRSLAIR